MKDLSYYLDCIKATHGVAMDKELASLLGIAPSTVTDMRRINKIPGEDLIDKIAHLCGEPPQIVALDLLAQKYRNPFISKALENAARLSA